MNKFPSNHSIFLIWEAGAGGVRRFCLVDSPILFQNSFLFGWPFKKGMNEKQNRPFVNLFVLQNHFFFNLFVFNNRKILFVFLAIQNFLCDFKNSGKKNFFSYKFFTKIFWSLFVVKKENFLQGVFRL